MKKNDLHSLSISPESRCTQKIYNPVCISLYLGQICHLVGNKREVESLFKKITPYYMKKCDKKYIELLSY